MESFMAKQDSLITLDQLRSFGMTARAASRMVAGGRWERVLPEVFRDAASRRSYRQVVRAATLWAGTGTAASHLTAAWMLRLVERAPASVEILVPRTRRLRSTGLVTVHQTLDLPPADFRFIDGIPLTRAARTLVDIADLVDEETLETALEESIRRALATEQSISDCLDRLGRRGRRGAGRLHSLLELRAGEPPAESRLEVKVLRILRAAGLPPPQRQFRVRLGSGGHADLDLAYPEWRLDIECDGDRWHRGRRRSARDRVRDSELAALGWRVLHPSWDDATQRPDVIVRWVTSGIRAA